MFRRIFSTTAQKHETGGNCEFGHIYFKKSLMENLIFCAVYILKVFCK